MSSRLYPKDGDYSSIQKLATAGRRPPLFLEASPHDLSLFRLGSPQNPAKLTACECIRHRRGPVHRERLPFGASQPLTTSPFLLLLLLRPPPTALSPPPL